MNALDSNILKLARPELLGRKGYMAALGRFDLLRLHANELPTLDDDDSGWNRYPPPRPVALTQRLGEVLGVPDSYLLVTRGSNEGIDLITRAFCRAGLDSIVTCPPTFGMYEVCAEVQGAGVLKVPLDNDFDLDTHAVSKAVEESNGTAKLVYLCSPANPTGAHLSQLKIDTICERLTDKALVVLDQAYIEFSDTGDLRALCDRYNNLVILRTFSKAYGLAGLRCGVVIASPEIIALLDSLLAPYSTPTPTIEGVLEALTQKNIRRTKTRLAEVTRQKKRLTEFLAQSRHVSYLFRSDSNFVLIRCPQAKRLYEHIHAKGILVRSFSGTERLEDCLRISVGNSLENDRLFTAFEDFNHDA